MVTKMNNIVIVKKVTTYDIDIIYKNLPESVFSTIKPTDKVVIEPNWVRHSHLNIMSENSHQIILNKSNVNNMVRVFSNTIYKILMSGKQKENSK